MTDPDDQADPANRTDWAARIAQIDTTVAHPARVYNYWLGGKENFAADREAAERVLAVSGHAGVARKPGIARNP